MIYVIGQDAVDAPFGAMLHIDWIEIKRNTQAFLAQLVVVCTDDTEAEATGPLHVDPVAPCAARREVESNRHRRGANGIDPIGSQRSLVAARNASLDRHVEWFCGR